MNVYSRNRVDFTSKDEPNPRRNLNCNFIDVSEAPANDSTKEVHEQAPLELLNPYGIVKKCEAGKFVGSTAGKLYQKFTTILVLCRVNENDPFNAL